MTVKIAGFLVFILSMQIAPASGADDKPRRVLMLHSYNYLFPSATTVADTARKRLNEKSPHTIEFEADFLDLARSSDPDHEDRMVAFLREKYARAPLDIIVTLGSGATFFMIKHRDRIAPNVPIVFTQASPATFASIGSQPNLTGIISEFDLDRTLELAVKLQPNARQLFIIAGSGTTDRRWQATARKIVAGRWQNLETTYLFELPYDRLLDTVSRLPDDAIVAVLTVFADGDGKPLIPTAVAAALAPISRAPIYSPYEHWIELGLVGGFVETFESVGIAAAELALQILSGTDIATLPPRINPLQAYRVNAKAMERWNLSERNLPEDTTVLFKTPTAWDEHRTLILAAVFVFTVQTAFLVALLVQARRRRRAEALAALQRQEIAHLMRVSTLGELSGAIAHEINQPLTAIQTNAETGLDLLAMTSPDTAELRSVLSDIVHDNERASEVIQRLRNLLTRGERKSEPVDINDLVTSTIALLRSELIGRRVSIELDLASERPTTFGDPVQLQQVMLNLLMNAMDAMADTADSRRSVRISTRRGERGTVEIAVRDQGSGVDATEESKVFQPFHTTKAHGLGLGLTICSTIVQSHGGTLTLRNAESGGAVATLSLPQLEFEVAAK